MCAKPARQQTTQHILTGTSLGKTAIVQFGELRSTVKADRLVKSESIVSSDAHRSVMTGVELHRRQSEFTVVLDIRGKRVEEVQALLVRFIDDAILLGQSEVKVLHGKGEGVLRTVVRDYLKKLKSVEGFRDEHADRGGDGITLVKLK